MEIIAKVAQIDYTGYSHIKPFLRQEILKQTIFNPDIINALAELALRNGDAKLAIKFTNGFAKKISTSC